MLKCHCMPHRLSIPSCQFYALPLLLLGFCVVFIIIFLAICQNQFSPLSPGIPLMFYVYKYSGFFCESTLLYACYAICSPYSFHFISLLCLQGVLLFLYSFALISLSRSLFTWGPCRDFWFFSCTFLFFTKDLRISWRILLWNLKTIYHWFKLRWFFYMLTLYMREIVTLP